MVIRSYRRVFKLDRRIYKLGDWTLPVPNGIPMRGFGYFLAAELGSLILTHLPIIALIYGVLPWPFRYVLLPLWVAAAGMRFEPDGRRAHRAFASWLAFQARRLHLRLTSHPHTWGGRLRVRWDDSDTVLHHGRITGPATVYFAVPIETNDRWNGWVARQHPDGQPLVVPVRADQTLKTRP